MDTNEHCTYYVLELLRSFLLCRHHIVTILGSEGRCSEYHRKFLNELVSRRQRVDPSRAITVFKCTSERGIYNRVAALAMELQITDLQHNVYLVDCFECDITFKVCDDNKGTAVVVNVEVDGPYHEKKRRHTFCRLRDKVLMSKGIHIVRITTRKTFKIDAILQRTVAHVRINKAQNGPS